MDPKNPIQADRPTAVAKTTLITLSLTMVSNMTLTVSVTTKTNTGAAAKDGMMEGRREHSHLIQIRRNTKMCDTSRTILSNNPTEHSKDHVRRVQAGATPTTTISVEEIRGRKIKTKTGPDQTHQQSRLMRMELSQ
jgi:hypothetical protein